VKRAAAGGLQCVVPTKPTLLLMTLVTLAPLSAQGFWDFEDRRVVSPSGRRYVVLRNPGVDGVTFEFCECAAGKAPMTPWMCESGLFGRRVDVSRDPADHLLAHGRLEHLPYEVIVPDRLPGFLLFEEFENFGRGKVVTWMGIDGNERFALDLRAIFGGAELGSSCMPEGTYWCQAHAFDDKHAVLLLVANSGEVREVAVADGAVATPDARRLADFANSGSESIRALALDVFAGRPAAASKEVLPIAAGVFHDRSEPMALRLRAAVALHRAGLRVHAAELFAAARAEDHPEAVRRYAVRHLVTVLGEAAIPVLRESMRGPAGPTWGNAYQALAEIGEPAVPTLLAMIEERDESEDYRAGALHALAAIRSPSARHGLLRAARADDRWVADAALGAVIATGGPDVARDLITLLAEAPAHTARIALHLTEHPDRAAAPALEAALQRVADGYERKWVQEAIDACRR